MKFEIFSQMKEQLLHGKELKKDEKQYLINLALNFEAGIDPLTVIECTQLIPTRKGKQSSGFIKATALKKSQLLNAVNLLDGANYTRCQKLADIIKNVKRQLKAGGFQSSNEIEKIIFQLLKDGLKLPGSPGRLYELLF